MNNRGENIMKLEVLESNLSIVKLPANAAIPNWAMNGDWFSITRTDDELSVVCQSSNVEHELGLITEHGWRGIKVVGELDFSLTGILSSLANPLAEHKISIFAISTYNTDYLLIKEESLTKAIEVLENEGHTFQ